MQEMTLEEYLQMQAGQKARASQRNSRNRKRGKRGETLVKQELERRGLHLVEKIEVGWGIKRDRRGSIKGAWPLEKVSGDYRAITSRGRSVLVEVKSKEERLPWSALRPHQREALDKHAAVGGLSLLAWVHDGEVSIMQWPVEGFVKRTSLSVEQAQGNEWGREIR